LQPSRRVVALVQELFGDIPDLNERATADAVIYDGIAEERQHDDAWRSFVHTCKVVVSRVEGNPASANREALELSTTYDGLPRQPGSVQMYRWFDARNALADALERLATILGTDTGDWSACMPLYMQAQKHVGDWATKRRIEESIENAKVRERFRRELRPISSAPIVHTVCGIGTTLYGSADHEPRSNSYLSTLYAVVLWVPVFPMLRYRVICRDGECRFLGRVPLRTLDKWHLTFSVLAIAAICIAVW